MNNNTNPPSEKLFPHKGSKQKPYTAREINASPILQKLTKSRAIDIFKKRIHEYRWHYCLGLMVKELLKLKDERIKRIFDKYHCVMTDEGNVGLLFPETLKEKNLPKHLRLTK